MTGAKRQFNLTKGERGAVPVWVGLSGPSGGGKTYSALRLATGIQSVLGGSIAVIDTEARRALHYSDLFEFEHCHMDPPFGSADFLAAVRYCREQGHRNLVIDSLTHEHSGPGGLLDFHESELDRLTKGDNSKRESLKFLAWQKPKKMRDLLIEAMVQMDGNFICCFRSKPSTKLVKKGKKTEMIQQGFMPITGDEWPFRMTVNLLLPPHSDGVPEWKSEYAGEKMMMKLPEQLKPIFLPARQLDEKVGSDLAEWARSGAKPAPADPVAPEPAREDTAPLLDEITAEFKKHGLTGQSDGEKKERKALLRDFFGAATWPELTGMDPEKLRVGLELLRAHLKTE